MRKTKMWQRDTKWANAIWKKNGTERLAGGGVATNLQLVNRTKSLQSATKLSAIKWGRPVTVLYFSQRFFFSVIHWMTSCSKKHCDVLFLLTLSCKENDIPYEMACKKHLLKTTSLTNKFVKSTIGRYRNTITLLLGRRHSIRKNQLIKKILRFFFKREVI